MMSVIKCYRNIYGLLYMCCCRCVSRSIHHDAVLCRDSDVLPRAVARAVSQRWRSRRLEIVSGIQRCGRHTVERYKVQIPLRRLVENFNEVEPRVFEKSTAFLQRAQCSHCERCISYGNSVCPSVRPSVCPSVTRRYCVKTAARSTVQFASLDSRMCLVL